MPNIIFVSFSFQISLRSWYREMEYYVAAFDYLHRAQLHWDHNKANDRSQVSRELYVLRNNAREILCNIEYAINSSTLVSKAKRTFDSLLISRKKMESQLQFVTDISHISPLNWDTMKNNHELYHINEVDLKVTKSRYIKYVRQFLKFLRKTTRQKGPVRLLGGKGKRQKKEKPKKTGSNRKTASHIRTKGVNGSS